MKGVNFMRSLLLPTKEEVDELYKEIDFISNEAQETFDIYESVWDFGKSFDDTQISINTSMDVSLLLDIKSV